MLFFFFAEKWNLRERWWVETVFSNIIYDRQHFLFPHHGQTLFIFRLKITTLFLNILKRSNHILGLLSWWKYFALLSLPSLRASHFFLRYLLNAAGSWFIFYVLLWSLEFLFFYLLYIHKRRFGNIIHWIEGKKLWTWS